MNSNDFFFIKIFQNTAYEGKNCWYNKYVLHTFKVRNGNETSVDFLVEQKLNLDKCIPVDTNGCGIILKRDCVIIKEESDLINCEIKFLTAKMGYK